jgi:hypothetical protein
MLLSHKNAVIYGAGLAVFAAVARGFARAGAKLEPVYVVGHDIGGKGAFAKLPAYKVIRQLHHQPLGLFNGRKESMHMCIFVCLISERCEPADAGTKRQPRAR